MSSVALITGSGGLIGSESVAFFSDKFDTVVGIDNNMREVFFGKEASTAWNVRRIKKKYGNYLHHSLDIRDQAGVEKIYQQYSAQIKLIIHAAAQPSHDWAAKDPFTDFSVNANGTLNLLEMTRKYCPDAVFIFTSTNKVYGDAPNSLPLIERESRWEIEETHPFYQDGIDETMPIDQSLHSLFGVSKAAADLLVQEYGKYFGMRTVCFRGGCLTGPHHSGTQLHGFLAYLMKCVLTDTPYEVFGYKGKQVRDNIHSYDLVNMFWHFYQNPRKGEVYNAGGSRHSNCSILEAIELCENLTGKSLKWRYNETNRLGDHIWWISNVNKFRAHYPDWHFRYNLEAILIQIRDELTGRQE
jgi:CDP-paratose 2-epimerase